MAKVKPKDIRKEVFNRAASAVDAGAAEAAGVDPAVERANIARARQRMAPGPPVSVGASGVSGGVASGGGQVSRSAPPMTGAQEAAGRARDYENRLGLPPAEAVARATGAQSNPAIVGPERDMRDMRHRIDTSKDITANPQNYLHPGRKGSASGIEGGGGFWKKPAPGTPKADYAETYPGMGIGSAAANGRQFNFSKTTGDPATGRNAGESDSDFAQRQERVRVWRRTGVTPSQQIADEQRRTAAAQMQAQQQAQAEAQRRHEIDKATAASGAGADIRYRRWQQTQLLTENRAKQKQLNDRLTNLKPGTDEYTAAQAELQRIEQETRQIIASDPALAPAPGSAPGSPGGGGLGGLVRGVTNWLTGAGGDNPPPDPPEASQATGANPQAAGQGGAQPNGDQVRFIRQQGHRPEVRQWAEQMFGPGAVERIASMPPEVPAAAPQNQPVRVSSSAELAALPSGTVFIAPDGTKRRKP